MFTTLTIKDKDYKLKLDAKASIELEKKLGTNPLNLLMKINNNNELPSLNTLLTIIHASMQAFNHGISLDDMYGIYDDFVEEGHTMLDLVPVIIEIFKVSGFINSAEEDAKN